jgi:hypothetical protein
MKEAVLLRQIRPKGHADLDLSGGNASKPRADRSHQLLRGETLTDALLEVRIAWFDHTRWEKWRRQLQALVRRRHNALVDCAPRLPLEYACHFVSVLSSCTVLVLVLSPGRISGVFLESKAFSTR